MVLGIEHLVGTEETRLLDDSQVHVANGTDAGEQVGLTVGIGLMEHAHVAQTQRAGLVGIEARNEDELVGHLFLGLGQAGAILEHGILAIGRAGADDDELARIAAIHNGRNCSVKGNFALFCLRRHRHLGLDVLRVGQAALKFHSHSHAPRRCRLAHTQRVNA